MLESIRKFFAQKDDRAVSPVIGTILMVAVTVILGATVYAAVNGFGGKTTKSPTDAVFRVSVMDTDGNGKTDAFKVTYITGPSNLGPNDVRVSVLKSGSTPPDPTAQSRTSSSADWNPGDFQTYVKPGPGVYSVSASVLGNAVLDQMITLDE